jgi:S1-C subfamily serine protease
MKSVALALALLAGTALPAFADPPANQSSNQSNLVDKLQSISVTIRAENSQGSGVLFTRKQGDETISFVWTAAHVIDSLRSTRKIIDPNSGTERTVVEFRDPKIVQEFNQNGRRIGEIVMDAKVIRFSDYINGQDLALLEIRKRNFVPETVTAQFYLDEAIPSVGTPLVHVGSLLGQFGSNSVTTGILSQIGRVLQGTNDTIYDQTTCPGFPGSSGGGVFLANDGRYVGMLVRGAGETFNLVVPARRLQAWAREAKVEWAIDQNIALPSDAERAKIKVEDAGVSFGPTLAERAGAPKEYPFLIKTTEPVILLEGDWDGWDFPTPPSIEDLQLAP